MSNFHLRVKVWIPDHIFNTVRQVGVAVGAYSGYKTNEKSTLLFYHKNLRKNKAMSQSTFWNKKKSMYMYSMLHTDRMN